MELLKPNIKKDIVYLINAMQRTDYIKKDIIIKDLITYLAYLCEDFETFDKYANLIDNNEYLFKKYFNSLIEEVTECILF